MTELLTYLFFFLCFAAAWAAVLRYDLQMFQQNSYMAGRYWTWLRPVLLGHRRWWFALLPLLCWSPALRVIAAVILFWSALLEFRTHYKVRIVYTKRVVRLIVTCILLGLLLLRAAYAAGGWKTVAVCAPLLLLCDKPLVVLANLINAPLEALIRRWYYNDAARMLRARPDLVIIGVTGSFGKTSTKNYLYRMLSERYNTLVTPGNFNTTLGVVRTVREQLRPYHQVFIVEMGAKQPGDIREICDLVHPTIGIVTAVGDMHLETFGSRENIQKTKFELIRALPPQGLGVINADSEGIATYKDIPDHCRMVRFGIDAHRADVRAADIVYSASGTGFTVVGPGAPLSLQTRLVGRGNVLDIVGACVVAAELGVSPQQIRVAVSKLQQVEHRLSVRQQGGLTILDDAYNANPEGAAMALDVLRGLRLDEGARRFVVTPGFVELGARQAEENRKLGARAARAADVLIVVNRLNREAICAGAREAGLAEDCLICADSLSEAVAALSGRAAAGDAVLYENDLPDMFK